LSSLASWKRSSTRRLKCRASRKRKSGVRRVTAVLNGVNGLPAHSHCPREIRRADAALLANRREFRRCVFPPLYAYPIQNSSLRAPSKSRGVPALDIEPNAADPKTPFGSFRAGVFVTLKASARKLRRHRSLIRNVFATITSAFCNPGPRTGLRELVPMVN
jgi:hypothetical protein